MLNKQLKTAELFDCKTDYLIPLFEETEYPWELLPKIKAYIRELIKSRPDGFEEIADGVLVGKDTEIHPSAVINGPTVIGESCEIRPGAFIRGGVITGSGCVIGNSTELKNCILLEGAQAPHYNYVGDSVLGNRAHMGAGAVCSNLKSDGKAVVIHSDTDFETSLRKVGGILGDGADIGCGCVLNPGTVIGKNTSVYPLNALRGVFPSDCIVKAQDVITERRGD